jgi:hypothetical protein
MDICNTLKLNNHDNANVMIIIVVIVEIHIQLLHTKQLVKNVYLSLVINIMFLWL